MNPGRVTRTVIRAPGRRRRRSSARMRPGANVRREKRQPRPEQVISARAAFGADTAKRENRAPRRLKLPAIVSTGNGRIRVSRAGAGVRGGGAVTAAAADAGACGAPTGTSRNAKLATPSASRARSDTVNTPGTGNARCATGPAASP